MSRFKHIITQEPSQQPQQELPPDWPTVFPKSIVGLDRDGVINHEVNYLHEIEKFKFINGVFEACQYFQNLNFKRFLNLWE